MTLNTNEPLTISPPRSPWREFILHFSTFGIYTCFWFVNRVRELKQLTDTRLTPWAWFFVPFVVLAQLFALRKFTATIRQLEEKYHIVPWGKSTTFVWIVVVIITTSLSNTSNKFEFPGWTIFCILTTWGLTFATFQFRINRIKNTVDNLKFNRPKNKFTLFEWFCLIILLPFTLTLTIFLAIEPLLTTEIQALEEQSVYQDPKGVYQFPVIGKNWSIVEKQTFSDGTAELELKGELSDMYFLLFSYGHNEDLNTLSYYRFDEAHKNMSFVSCTENRVFAEKHPTIISHTICNGLNLTDPAVTVSTIIETDKGLYELYGHFSSVKNSFKSHKDNFVSMAEGFKPL